MRLDLNRVVNNPIEKEEPTKATSQAAQGHRSVRAQQDTATLSSDASRIQSLESAAMAMPPVREEKVRALQTAIANGDYKVDPEKIADAMLQEKGKL